MSYPRVFLKSPLELEFRKFTMSSQFQCTAMILFKRAGTNTVIRKKALDGVVVVGEHNRRGVWEHGMTLRKVKFETRNYHTIDKYFTTKHWPRVS